MAKVLMGWSYGAGFGHVGRLMAIAEGLRRLGHTSVLALSAAENTRPIWEGRGAEIIEAPSLQLARLPRTRQSESLADTLVNLRFHEIDNLLALGRGWNDVLVRVNPDLVICDYCPHLALAARDRVPVLAVGTGFTVPPAGREFPPLDVTTGAVSEEGRRIEWSIHETVNAVARQLNQAPVAFVADILGGDQAFACCLPELDPYRAYREQPAIGGFQTAEPKSDSSMARVFAYLAAGRDLSVWLEGLANSGMATEAYVRDMVQAPPAKRVNTQMVIHDRPVDLASTLPLQSLIVHHGGANTTELALRIGVPQLIIPTQREQQITGKLLRSIRAGGSFGASRPSAEKLTKEIRNTATNQGRQRDALRIATTIAERKLPSSLDTILDACVRYL